MGKLSVNGSFPGSTKKEIVVCVDREVFISCHFGTREVGFSRSLSIATVEIFWSEKIDDKLKMEEYTVLISCLSEARSKISLIALDLTDEFKLSLQESASLYKKLVDDWEQSYREYKKCIA